MFEPTTERGIFVGYETSKAFRIYLPSQRKVVVRREVRFEEEWAFRKSKELVQEEQQVPPPQEASQVPSIQGTSSQVFGVTGPQVTGTGFSGSVVQLVGTLERGFGCQVTGSPYIAIGS